MNGKNLACLVASLAVLADVAPGQVITIDPNSFSSGQVINVPGVTLETETFVQTGADSFVPTFFGPVYSVNIGAGCSGLGCPPNGTSVFAPSSTGGLPLPDNANWGPGGFWGDPFNGGEAVSCSQNCSVFGEAQGSIVLRLEFAQPVSFVDALALSNGGDPTQIAAFDSTGNLVGGADNGCSPICSSGGFWGDATITTATPDISTVLIAGRHSFRPISEISYAAPEIDPASVASGLTLLLGGLFVLRGRRPMKRDSIASTTLDLFR